MTVMIAAIRPHSVNFSTDPWINAVLPPARPYRLAWIATGPAQYSYRGMSRPAVRASGEEGDGPQPGNSRKIGLARLTGVFLNALDSIPVLPNGIITKRQPALCTVTRRPWPIRASRGRLANDGWS
jgi:hypothetical protein